MIVPNFLTERNTLPNENAIIDSNILNQADTNITISISQFEVLQRNQMKSSIDFLLTSKRFDEPFKFLTIKIS